jgi:putative salt-induced outer membrane protein YdiY
LNQGASAGARASRKTEKDRFSLRFLYNYAEEDGEVSARNTYSALKYDYFFTEKTYGLIGIELLSDEFKDLNLRTVVGPGVGYQVCDKPDKSLGLEAGVSYFSEDRKEVEDFGEYQLRNEAALASPLTSGWSLKLTNIIEHDSNPPVGIEKSDIYWLFGLAYNF